MVLEMLPELLSCLLSSAALSVWGKNTKLRAGQLSSGYSSALLSRLCDLGQTCEPQSFHLLNGDVNFALTQSNEIRYC